MTRRKGMSRIFGKTAGRRGEAIRARGSGGRSGAWRATACAAVVGKSASGAWRPTAWAAGFGGSRSGAWCATAWAAVVGKSRSGAWLATAWAAGLAAWAGPLADRSAGAQLASAAPSTQVVGHAVTATARGIVAVAANPAGLAMPGGPRWSLALAPVQWENGLGPLGIGDLARAGGQVLASATKEDWLDRIAADGGQTGPIRAGVTWAAFSSGRLGLQLSTQMASNMDLSPGLVEFGLYGNAGRAGAPADLTAGASSADAWAVSTAGLAYAVPFSMGEGTAALGVTAKYSLGHLGAVLDGQRATATASPLAVVVNAPVVYTSLDDVANAGSGFGLDVGFQYAAGRFAGGLAVQNAFNTFAWDDAKTRFRRVAADIRGGEFDTDLAIQSVAQAPAALASRWEDMTFRPRLSAGAAFEATPALRLSAQATTHFGDGMRAEPKLTAGAGGEWRASETVAVALGAGVVTGGFEFGGAGLLSLGAVELSGGGGWRRSDAGEAMFFTTALSYVAR